MAETALVTTPFIWEGTDRKGNRVKGKSMASTEAAVRADLRRQGVVPTRIRKQRQKPFSAGAKVTTADIAVFSRQLATMLAAGIPLVQAFEIVGTGHDNPAMQKLILGIKADVEGGSALAEALAKQPRSKPANRRAHSKPCSTRSPPIKRKPKPSRKRSRKR
jgi:type IV pilus assembly protein PilC